METSEGNRLIAEFMGAKIKHGGKGGLFVDPCTGFPSTEKGLEYNESWDWLIPVIDKIYSHNDYPKYKRHTGSMIDEGGIYINTRFIESTHEQVVDFIVWLNNKPE